MDCVWPRFCSDAESVTAFASSQFGEAIFASTASYLVSLLAFFVPGGIGVRESVLIFILASVLQRHLWRQCRAVPVVVILAELLGGLIGLGLGSNGGMRHLMLSTRL